MLAYVICFSTNIRNRGKCLIKFSKTFNLGLKNTGQTFLSPTNSDHIFLPPKEEISMHSHHTWGKDFERKSTRQDLPFPERFIKNGHGPRNYLNIFLEKRSLKSRTFVSRYIKCHCKKREQWSDLHVRGGLNNNIKFKVAKGYIQFEIFCTISNSKTNQTQTYIALESCETCHRLHNHQEWAPGRHKEFVLD